MSPRTRPVVAPAGPAAPRPPVVVGYVRVSTLTQVTDGDGLGVQRDKITGWCMYQSLPAPKIEQDAAISGSATENRPGLQHALRGALEAQEKGNRATLVVYKLDRLGRNAIDVQEVLATLLDAGVRVVSLSDGVDSESGMGAALLKLLTNILATFAELEKETIRVRLLEGRRRADASDRTYAVEPRYGRRVVEGTRALTVDKMEARTVERIRELRGEGKSYRAIGDALLEEGLRPRRAPAWSPIVVQRMATGYRAPRMTKTTSARTARVRAEIMGATSPATSDAGDGTKAR